LAPPGTSACEIRAEIKTLETVLPDNKLENIPPNFPKRAKIKNFDVIKIMFLNILCFAL
jgi:hypothetical protein